jgi:hypothetical protein
MIMEDDYGQNENQDTGCLGMIGYFILAIIVFFLLGFIFRCADKMNKYLDAFDDMDPHF